MKATGKLHDLGQSIWLDNITRDLLSSGTLKRYIDELSVTELTSNPTIFDHAIKNSTTYDGSIRQKLQAGQSGEERFFDLAPEDLSQAADLFKPIFERTNGVGGWVSLEVSPLLAHDTASTLAAARALHDPAGRANHLLIQIPGTPEGLPDMKEVWRRGSVVARSLGVSPEWRWTIKPAIDEAVPAHVLSSALYERFSSRGEADFADKLLSAMR